MEQIAAFKASDGTIFASAERCQEHEEALAWAKKIDKFLESGWNQYPAKMHSSMSMNIIISWERFKKSGGEK